MENSIDTVIGINVTVKGNLYNKGSIQVNGNVEGEVKSDENIMIGETAKIKGPVIAAKVEISGEVRGLVEEKTSWRFIQPEGFLETLTPAPLSSKKEPYLSGKVQCLRKKTQPA